jgi:hypothetical protein
MLKLSGLALVVSIGILGAGSAAAQTWVVGSGDTKTAAVYQTQEAARVKAKAQRTCYQPVQEAFCRTDESGDTWSCIAKVTSFRIDGGQMCRVGEVANPRAAFKPINQISPWVIAEMQAKEAAAKN